MKDFYFFHKLKLILFFQDQIQLDICYFSITTPKLSIDNTI